VTVQVRLFGEFREYLPEGATGGRASIELPEGATVFSLVDRLGLPYEAEEGVIAVAVNDEVTDLKAPLADGDVVSMFPPLAGGVESDSCSCSCSIAFRARAGARAGAGSGGAT
jgi:molybdopterin converting factor small subunit